jgi:hypothetical protein
MANENTTGGALTATVGEQLAGKHHEPPPGMASGEAQATAAGEGTGERPGAEGGLAARGTGGHEQRRRPSRGLARGVPGWLAFAGAAIGWALLSSAARGVRRGFRRRGRRSGLRRRR